MTTPRVLITGARGFVGSQIRACLPDGYDVHAVARGRVAADGATWHQADLRDPADCHALIRDVRPTHLVHSAWETTHGAFWESDKNRAWLEAGKALFTAFHTNGGQRIVGCGTCAEYVGASRPLREEDDDQVPPSQYGRAKRDLLNALREMPVSFAWARIFYPYGAHENPARFVPSICRSLLQDDPAQCSSGTQTRNFIDVRDLGAAIAALVDSNLVGPINVGNPISHRLGDVAKLLGQIADRPDLIALGALPDREGEPAILIPDLRRQTEELEFGPKINISRGMSDAYRWWADEMAVGHAKDLS
ncbi:NAD-dependent epimerase/dehydratase family protein [Erythrobacter sp. MTPC3]|uniref:NAD-dependent epimerase/dehydratase family protein n=1 Tax=Erythrobacter sp. MTPC3 TaxID=3056564 RepID=UPI0036F24F6D